MLKIQRFEAKGAVVAKTSELLDLDFKNLIKTERLIIGHFEEDDFEGLLSMMSDADTMRYTGFKEPQSKERVKSLLSKWKKEGQGPLGTWAVRSRESKKFIGWVMLKPTSSEVPELGYMIHKPHWGQGYASELASGMLKYGANTLAADKVVAVTSPENKASMRVLEKAGMKKASNAPREDGGICFEIVFKQ